MCLQTPPPGSVFLRGPGCLGSLGSCPLRDCAAKTGSLSQIPSMGCHMPRKCVGQGSCAAPLGPHVHSDRFCSALVLYNSRSLISQGLYPSETRLCPFLGMGPEFPNYFWHWRAALITFHCLEFWLLHLAHLGTNTIVNKLVKIQIAHIKLIQHSVKIPRSPQHPIASGLSWAVLPEPCEEAASFIPTQPSLATLHFTQTLSRLPQLHTNSSTHLAPPLTTCHTEHENPIGLMCFS